MTNISARSCVRTAILAGLVLATGILLFVLARGFLGSSQLAAAPSPAPRSSSLAGRTPSPRLLLAAAHMREAHILAAEAHPQAVHSLASPQEALPGNAPNPIPAVFFFPGPGMEASTITDFNGFTGVAAISGTGTETESGVAMPGQDFDSDDRFMQGTYVGVDGNTYQGTFVFL